MASDSTTAPTPLRTSAQVRALSKAFFNSLYRVEVAQAVRALSEVFFFEELESLLRQVAVASDVDPPSPAKLREELSKLREIGALERLPRVKGDAIRREVRKPSALWPLADELQARAIARPPRT
jgi:hypothetical protein